MLHGSPSPSERPAQSLRLEPSPPVADERKSLRRRLRLLPILATLAVAAVAAVAVWLLWQNYMESPWTRDGTVRAYVVTLAPEVSGNITELAVKDNQRVWKGDLLMKIDPRDYQLAVEMGNAAVDQAQADFENKKAQAARRLKLSDLAATAEEKQTFVASANMASANIEKAKADLDRAKLNLARTEIRSPVNGWVTNLLVRQGDYATTGQTALSIVDADSFWVDGYFEETAIPLIRNGDPANIWLLGYKEMLRGHVDSVAHGIVVSNATPGKSGLATVNPIFTWVRLAQRVPVRVHIDDIPPDVRLVIGMTATIEVEPQETAPPEPEAGTGSADMPRQED
ncbi:HlyD family secretion protein [Mesorhizobium sp. KR2-14]|uniref:HlyD family secretion protein n=1 Tax=Mesorhizobium sp. KR2-14 TaxID=3156610 RepID=UPI0032B50551